ncbi:hypothetical protein M5K25_003508 [Dendrobium thyrsiflorum]|uniref:Uncharacterized protein n=1 Tax=Dendrobium thyrsiflorum TaxID=117978 RepID=A0ABD0VKR3_DENTH
MYNYNYAQIDIFVIFIILLSQPRLPVASPPAAYTVGKLFHFSANAARATDDEPPSVIAAAASTSSSFALFLNLSPSSPSINSFTTLLISSLSKIPSFLAFNLIATFAPSTIMTEFILCSANSGQTIIGTPRAMLSKVEFHPQCDRNPPVEE